MGPVSDLLVVSRPQGRRGRVARLFMLAALLDSSRPVLVLPQRGAPAIGQRISIAWNQSAEAARVVAAALPLIQRAEEVYAKKLWREQLSDWDERRKPTSIAAHRELQSVEPDRLSDAELAAYLTRCRDHHAAMMAQHMRFTAGAVVGITIVAGIPRREAARATAWAWFPELWVTTPWAACSSLSLAMAL